MGEASLVANEVWRGPARSWTQNGGPSRLTPVMEVPNTKRNVSQTGNLSLEIVVQFRGLDDGAYGAIVLVRMCQDRNSLIEEKEGTRPGETEAVVGTIGDYMVSQYDADIGGGGIEEEEVGIRDKAEFAGLVAGLKLAATGSWLSVVGTVRRHRTTLVVETDSDTVLARLRSSEKKDTCTAKRSQRAEVASLLRRLKDSGDFDSVGTRQVPTWRNSKAEALAQAAQASSRTSFNHQRRRRQIISNHKTTTSEAFQQTSGWRLEFDIAIADETAGVAALLFEIDSDGIPQLKKCRRRSFKGNQFIAIAPCQALLVGLELAVEAGAHSVVALAPPSTATALQNLYKENKDLYAQIERYATGFRDGLRLGMLQHDHTMIDHSPAVNAQQLAIEALEDLSLRTSARDDGLCRLGLRLREALDDVATNNEERFFRQAAIDLLSSQNKHTNTIATSLLHQATPITSNTNNRCQQQQRHASFILLNQHHVPNHDYECYSDCGSVSSLQSCSAVSSSSSASPLPKRSGTFHHAVQQHPFPSHLAQPKELLDEMLASRTASWWRTQLCRHHLDHSVATVAAHALGHWHCGSLLQILDLNRFVRSRSTRQSVSSFEALALGQRQAYLDSANSWRREAYHYLGENSNSLAAFIGILMVRFFRDADPQKYTRARHDKDQQHLPLDEDDDYDMPPISQSYEFEHDWNASHTSIEHDGVEKILLRVECLEARSVEPLVSEFGAAVHRTEWYYAVYEAHLEDDSEKELFRFYVHCSDTMLNNAARFMVQITLDKETAEGDEVRDLFVLFKALCLARANSDPEISSLHLIDNIYQSAARCSCDSGASCCLAHRDTRHTHSQAFPTNALGHRLPSLFPPDYLHDYEEATFAYCGTGWGRKPVRSQS